MVQITPEQIEALAQAEDHCLRIRDPRTNKQYVIYEEPAVPEADTEHIEYMRRGLEEAEASIARGEGVPWDPDAMRRDGMKRLNDAASDSLLSDTVVFDGPTPPDLSARHDDYLYGDKQ